MEINSIQIKRIIELILLFVCYPVLLSISVIPTKIKLGFVPFLLMYVGYISYINRKKLFKKHKQIKPNSFWKHITLRLFGVIIITVTYLFYIDKSLLFKPVILKTDLWIKMIFVYSFFSVLPQEYLYRSFYFNRYQSLFKNQEVFFVVNAIVFSLAHLFFKNTMVLILTLVGGYIFAKTYTKTKSLFWTSIEHVIYGVWLFTVGMGTMLGFPI